MLSRSLLFGGGTPACNVSYGYFALSVDFGRRRMESLLLFCQRDLSLQVWPALRSLLMNCLHCPQYLTVHPRSASHCLSHRRPPLRRAHFHFLTQIPPRPPNVLLASTTFNDSELSTAAAAAGLFNDEGNMFSARSRTSSHQRSSLLTCKGFSPREANLLKSSWSRTSRSHCHVNPKILKDFCR
jgi:hypothetical protein